MTEFLLLATILLGAGVLAVPLATRLGLGSVLGYLIAGIAISPVLNFLNVDVIAIQHFAEFGVVIMLFLVGLELSPDTLWEMRKRLLGLGGGQLALTTALVFAASLALGLDWRMALAVGLVLSLSSTAIALQTLNEKGLLKADGGQASFSVLLFQDIAVIPMLALMPLLVMPEAADIAHATAATAHGDDAAHGPELSLVAGLNGWQTALVTMSAIAGVVVFGGYLTQPLFRYVTSAGLREMLTAVALLIVIGISLLMYLVGLSPALGAFIAGVVLAGSEYSHELESDIDPFRGLLLGLFFITVGAGIDFNLLLDNWGQIVALTIALIAVKCAVLYGLGLVFKIRGAQRWLLALGLAQAGEFGFVLLSFTVANGVLPHAIADRLMLVVALSMLLTPILFTLYDTVIADIFARGQEREDDTIDERNGVIICGVGRVGGLVYRMLNSAGIESTVIDFSARQLDIVGRFGMKGYFGDATRPELLHSAGIEDARLLVVAIDNREQINKIVEHTIKHHPDLHIVARAVNRHHVYELWELGCRDIIRENFDSTLRMGRSVFEALGAERDAAQAAVDAFEKMDRQYMVEVADAYDSSLPAHENQEYIDRITSVREEHAEAFESRMHQLLGLSRAQKRDAHSTSNDESLEG